MGKERERGPNVQREGHHGASEGDSMDEGLGWNPFSRNRGGSNISDETGKSPLFTFPFKKHSTESGAAVGGPESESQRGSSFHIADNLREWKSDLDKSRNEEEEFRQKIRAKKATLDKRLLEDEISVLSLIQYLAKEIKKFRQYRTLPLYILFLIVFVISLSLTRFEGLDSKLYFRSLATKKTLSADVTDHTGINNSFLDIYDSDSFFAWMILISNRLWDGTVVYTNNAPLGYMVIRQWRVAPKLCTDNKALRAISPSAKNQLTRDCYPAYDSDLLSYEPYGPGLIWKANRDVPDSLPSVEVDGRVHTLDNLEAAFSLYLKYSSTNAQVLQTISDLRNNDWVDEQTRAISVGVVTFNQPDSIFVHSELSVEITESGVWLPSLGSKAFTLFTLVDVRDYVVLVIDGLIFLWVIRDLVYLVISIKQEQELTLAGYFTFGNWNIFIIILEVAFGFFFYYRINLWLKGLEINDTYYQDRSTAYGGDEDKLMYQLLVDYGVMYHNAFTILSMVLPLCWLRVFSFVQYNERFNGLTETMKYALTNLVSLGVIFVSILIGFAMGGHVLYGYDFEPFRDVIKSAGYLLRVLVSSEIPDYQHMTEIHTLWTALFFTTYLLLAWLLILNMVLGVIAGSYAIVQEHRSQEVNWNVAIMWGDAKKWWMKVRNKHLTYMADPASDDREREENYVSSRVKAVGVLKKWFFSDENAPEYISKQKLKEYLGGEDGILCDTSIDQVFLKAGRRAAGGSHAIRLGERWAAQLQSRTRTMEQHLSNMQGAQDQNIGAMSQQVTQVSNNLEKTKSVVSDMSKTTGAMAKDVRSFAQAAAASKSLESQVIDEMRKVRGQVATSAKKARNQQNQSFYDYDPVTGGYNFGAPSPWEEMTPRASRSRSNSNKKKKRKNSKKRDSTQPGSTPSVSTKQESGVTTPLLDEVKPLEFIDPGLGWDDPISVVTTHPNNTANNKKKGKHYLPDGKLDV